MKIPSDLQGYLESTGKFRGIKVGRRGDELVSHCPFPERHDKGDRHPSWGINMRTGYHNCFSCGAGGRFEELVRQLDLPILVEMDADSDPDEVVRGIRERLRGRVEEVPFWPLPPTFALFDRRKPNETLRYLLGKGIEWDSIVERGIGWDTQTRAVIYPIADADGNQVAWQKRNIPPNDYVPYLFPDDFDKTAFVYGLSEVSAPSPVVVESLKTSIILCARGIPAVSILNADMSPNQAAQLGRYLDVTLLLDGDVAGRNGTAKAMDLLLKHHPGRTYYALLPLREGKDTSPDDYDLSVVKRAIDRRRPNDGGPNLSKIRKKLDSFARH